jgi:Uncharacterised nucleotidyltransferase
LEFRGLLVSAILAGSWRRCLNQALDLTELQLDQVTPLLYGSGAAALGWRRVCNTELRTTASAQVLQQAYRLLVLQSAIHEENIKTVFQLLREHAIEAILIKGWAAAGLYPERALRPYGDIDLFVRSSDWKTAGDLLALPEAAGCWVDLHKRISELDDRTVDQLFERSRSLPLGGTRVRVLAPEDHLALLAIHLLKHGAWRPLWFCDIGAAIESLPKDFDWELCFGKNRRRAGWIKSAILLAHRLLAARVDHLPLAEKEKKLPPWLVAAVLKQWEHPFAVNQPPMCHSAAMASHLLHPAGLLKGIQERWPNPILATVSINGSFNNLPRLPYQIGNCTLRAGRFLIKLPQLVHEHRRQSRSEFKL